MDKKDAKKDCFDGHREFRKGSTTYQKKGSVLTASILIGSWSLGSVFFGTPIATGTSGFLPGMSVNIVVYLWILAASLLYAEAILAFPDGSNIVSISKKLIGRVGTLFIVLLFFVLHYSYINWFSNRVGPIVSQILQSSFSLSLSPFLSTFYLLLFVSLVVFLGVWVTSRMVLVLSIGLIVSTVWFFLLQINQISYENIFRTEWAFFFLAIPSFVATYYFQGLLPTISTYLHKNPQKICNAILIGTSFILIYTTLWQLLVIGSIPGPQLWEAQGSYGIIFQRMVQTSNVPFLISVYNFISFFIMITSLLVAGCLLVDALGDGFHITLKKRVGFKRALLCLLVFIPGLLLSRFEWVITAEDIISTWGEPFFVAIVPPWLVWQVRYSHKLESHRFLPGGRLSLILFSIISFLLFYVESASFLWSSTI